MTLNNNTHPIKYRDLSCQDNILPLWQPNLTSVFVKSRMRTFPSCLDSPKGHRGCHGREAKIYDCGFNPCGHARNFLALECKNINKARSVRAIVICSDHRYYSSTLIKVLISFNLRWVYTAQDFYKYALINIDLMNREFGKKCHSTNRKFS